MKGRYATTGTRNSVFTEVHMTLYPQNEKRWKYVLIHVMGYIVHPMNDTHVWRCIEIWSSTWWKKSRVTVICVRNSPVTGEFPTQMPVTRSFDVFFDLHLNKRLSKQSWGWWFETASRSLWRHCNVSFSFLQWYMVNLTMVQVHVSESTHKNTG